ncbi:4-coumarate--CoA ligase 1-like [Pogonomyrmex barbatus]|uniref:4-coumarate--CoA ligase 1-like n=1 Tax=Pogonomyrmex barbatus TaxID=144034 RepID=A0A6I9W4Y4_9HYME|nr:4-coumarate--CoA ligase 1-like [Pogonomyrmex barbatus]XP_011636486.1 4-coumarate--CoA ligase 1-like [Pogonomyrmex barbatus]
MMKNNSKDFTVENGIYKGPINPDINYKSLGEMIWFNIKKNGDKIAHLDACTEETTTYTQLQDKVIRCALWLQKYGIKSGDIISLCTGNHMNSIVPCLSAAYINAIFNTWYEDMDLRSALYYLNLIMPKIIFCSEKSVHVILSAVKEKNCNSTVVVFGKHINAISFSDILKTGSDAEVANFHYEDLDDIRRTACIVHSSGTTGLPKGIEISNYNVILTSERSILDMIDSPVLWFSCLCWVTGIMMNMFSIIQSSKVILYPEFDEEIICQLIEKYKITTLFLSTSITNRLVKAGHIKKYSLSSLKNIMFGGAMLKPKIQEEFRNILPHVAIYHGYGMTELSGLAACQKKHHKNGSCGTVFDNVQMKIVDPESGKTLGPNQSGEIYLKSATFMISYYKNPEATKNSIDSEGWFRSGDFGYVDEDGELFIIGRLKELIKYKGYQVSPGEIENVLMSHPAVLESAVIGIPHELDDEHPLAFIVKKPGAMVTEQELINFVANNMTDLYKLRAGVIFVDNFPYLGTGKVSKKDLKIMAKQMLNYTD